MPHIIGNRIFLREYLMTDVEALYQWRTQDDIVWWTGSYLWPESLEQAYSYVVYVTFFDIIFVNDVTNS